MNTFVKNAQIKQITEYCNKHDWITANTIFEKYGSCISKNGFFIIAKKLIKHETVSKFVVDLNNNCSSLYGIGKKYLEFNILYSIKDNTIYIPMIILSDLECNAFRLYCYCVFNETAPIDSIMEKCEELLQFDKQIKDAQISQKINNLEEDFV